jgi:alkylated DNA repair dioxygenase AlkB
MDLEFELIEEIPGLIYCCNAISVQVESTLIKWLDTQPWSTELSRRTQQYGRHYNYKGSSLSTEAKPLSGPIKVVRDWLDTCQIIDADQCIVNEYTRNQGIAPHIDRNVFGPVVVGLSLGESTDMIFSYNNEEIPILLERRSLVIMEGDARYKYKHSISSRVTGKSQDYRRISVTYRTSL